MNAQSVKLDPIVQQDNKIPSLDHVLKDITALKVHTQTNQIPPMVVYVQQVTNARHSRHGQLPAKKVPIKMLQVKKRAWTVQRGISVPVTLRFQKFARLGIFVL